MGVAQTIKIEDLEVRVPSTEKSSGTIKKTSTIKGSKTAILTTKKKTYTIPHENNEVLKQLEELTQNAYFLHAPIYGLERRLNTGFLEKFTRNWQYGVSNIDLTITRGYGKFLFQQKNIERPLHNRWKYLISEDFDTDSDWNTNADIAATPFTSEGDSKQSQLIPWDDISGDWESDTDWGNHLSGTQCLLHNDDVAAILVAGWDWWENYEIEVWFYCDDSITDDTGIVFRYVDSTNHYKFMNTESSSIGLYDNTTAILVDTSLALVADTYYHMKVRVQGHKISCYLNGEKLFNGEDIIDKTYTSGRVGLYSALNNTYFDKFKVTLLSPTNFNLPASVDWTNQYSHADIITAYGTQKKLIATDHNVQFKQSRAGGDCVLYLPMDEGQGNVLHDHSKDRNNFTIGNYNWVDDEEKGYCIEATDDNDSSGPVVNANALDYNNGFTVDIEVNAVNFDDAGYIYSFTGDTDCRVYFILGSSTIKFVTGTYVEWGLVTISADTWYRVTLMVFPVTSTTATCFALIDGKIVARYDATFGGDGTVDSYNLGSVGYTHHTARFKNLRVYNTPRWDVAHGHDSTPATVFCWDDNRFDSTVDYPDDSDCVLLLHMDEGSGTTIVYDASGNNNDFTTTGNPVYINTSFRGEAGICIHLDGDGDFLSRNSDLGILDNWTIEMWISVQAADKGTFFAVPYSISSPGLELSINADGYLYLRNFNTGGSSPITIGTTDLTDGKWYYVVITYDGANQRIYVNGVEENSDPQTGITRTNYNKTFIGVTSDGYTTGVNALNAYYDEVRVHLRALSSEEIVSRYRSEPYLHDWYQMTRVYHNSHDFSGLPVITNGQIMLSFPDYDTYEWREDNVLLPTIYGWYENSWHLLGHIEPISFVNGVQYRIDNFNGCDWSIEELTDQYCKMNIRYYISDISNVPEGTFIDFKLIIRNGFSGILIETDGRNWLEDDSNGFNFFCDYQEGNGITMRYWFSPDDSFKDTTIESGGTEDIDYVDDNWWVMYGEDGESDAPSKQVIIGGFVDMMYEDKGDAATVTWSLSSSDETWWSECRCQNSKFGGIFFVPYDISTIVTTPDDIPKANAVNYPSDLAHQAFKETMLKRGLKK